jgi:hypothetical protein
MHPVNGVGIRFVIAIEGDLKTDRFSRLTFLVDTADMSVTISVSSSRCRLRAFLLLMGDGGGGILAITDMGSDP